MRAYDNGSFFTVTYSAEDAREFRSQWPGSSVRGRGAWGFQKRNGDLIGADGSASENDGDDWLAFSHDCEAYGRAAIAKKRKVVKKAPQRNPTKKTALPAGWAKAVGTAGYSVGSKTVYGAYVKGRAVFAWKEFPDWWVGSIVGLMLIGDATLADIDAKARGYFERYENSPGEYNRRLSRRQFDALMVEPRSVTHTRLAALRKRQKSAR